MMAAAAFCFCKDDLIRANANGQEFFFTSSIPLNQLLESVGIRSELIDNDAKVNFTHFTRIHQTPLNDGVLQMLWERHAACYCPDNYEATDLIIPVQHERKIKALKVQVKNYEAPLSLKMVQDLSFLMLLQRDCTMVNFAIIFAAGHGSFSDNTRSGQLPQPTQTRSMDTQQTPLCYATLHWDHFRTIWAKTLRDMCSVDSICESSLVMKLGCEYFFRQQTVPVQDQDGM
jgi:hypothetical protein